MEGKRVLMDFFERISNDAVIDSKHIAIFFVLYTRWMQSGFQTSIRVRSKGIMNEAKISSSSTFFDKLRYLHDRGYIIYHPSYCLKEGSRIAFNGY